jgi:hypothetical protein
MMPLKNDKLMLKKGNTVDEWTRLDNDDGLQGMGI